MRETAAELAELQALIDRSHAGAKPHMAGIIHPGKYSLTAAQVVRLFDGMKTIAVAAPAPNGDPLVGPMDGWFLHGKFFWSSGGDAVRIKGLTKRPRASAVYYEGERFAITAHGHAELTLMDAFIRYLGFLLSVICVFIGVIWVAFDANKQGWHDKIAGTYVVKA